MKIKLLSQNIRDLNDPVAIDNLRLYLNRNPVDILFLQKHKLQGPGASNLRRQLWKRARYLYTEAEPGYTLNRMLAGKGGVAAFISPKWTNLVTQSGILFGGRILWFVISRLQGGDVGFIDVYAPTDSHPHKVLWEALAREIQLHVGGYFQATLTWWRDAVINPVCQVEQSR